MTVRFQPPRVIDVDAIISLFKRYPADFIALQEADVNMKRSGTNEVKMVEDLDMHFFLQKLSIMMEVIMGPGPCWKVGGAV